MVQLQYKTYFFVIAQCNIPYIVFTCILVTVIFNITLGYEYFFPFREMKATSRTIADNYFYITVHRKILTEKSHTCLMDISKRGVFRK